MSESAWMLTRGSYSDYRVVAVFLEKGEADAYADRWNKDYDLSEYDSYSVEAISFRPQLPEEGTYCFRVYITRKGDIVECSKSEYSAHEAPHVNIITSGYAGPGWNVCRFARDPDHAKKLASEYRQAELAKEAMAAVAHPCVGSVVLPSTEEPK